MRIENNETVDVRGNLIVSSGTLTLADGQLNRVKLATDNDATHTIPIDTFKTWDDLTSFLPGTAASDDLAIIEGTLGTDAPTLQTSDSKATNVTQYARIQYVLPANYISGGDIAVRVRAGMVTTISDGTASVDVECYAHDDDGAVGSDLCTTTATTINNLTKSDIDFTITPTGLTAGDTLDIRVGIDISDTATGTAVIGEISKVSALVDIR